MILFLFYSISVMTITTIIKFNYFAFVSAIIITGNFCKKLVQERANIWIGFVVFVIQNV